MQRIALIGFGTVGQGLAEILLQKENELKKKYGYEWQIVAVSDAMKGSVFCSEGLDVPQLLHLAKENTSLTNYVCSKGCNSREKGWDAVETITKSNADVVCELAYTDLSTGEPAITHCKTAFETGKHIVTSNKGPAALAYRKMKKLADDNNVQFRIEGTVMSGTPILNLVEGPLAGNTIHSVKGIMNGTTNYILSQMEDGMTYNDALQKAKEFGYAEADPTGDVEGYDARAKVTILANVVMGESLNISDVSCQGITEISLDDIAKAKEKNARWKLIGCVENIDDKINAYVRPELMPMTHPLAGIMGATNAVTFNTDLMGDVTIVGAGAGRIETGFSILTDLLKIHKTT
ncbi:MAG: homoserine dehydrogenase [Candidatus Marinimicrobia bacterium]|nr:homoserine dehydrogenase [Candidatus Neomarinimicrobiota bacterium]